MDPARGAYSAPPDSLLVGGGSKNPTLPRPPEFHFLHPETVLKINPRYGLGWHASDAIHLCILQLISCRHVTVIRHCVIPGNCAGVCDEVSQRAICWWWNEGGDGHGSWKSPTSWHDTGTYTASSSASSASPSLTCYWDWFMNSQYDISITQRLRLATSSQCA